MPRHLRRGHRGGQRDQQDQPLGDDVDDPRGERLDRVGLADVAERQRDAERRSRAAPSTRPSRSAAGPSPAPAASAGGGRRAPSRSAGRRGCRRRPRSPRSRPRPRPRRSRRGPRRRPAAATGSDSPVSSDSSSASPSARTRSPSAAIWSPLAIRTRSPTTTSPTGTCRGAPSRTTVAFATTSAASLSSVRLARTSWKVPIATLATRMPRKSASFGLPKMIVAAPNPARIALKTVKVLATAIER